ncbi:MAG: hypothetical protein M3464_12815 [Chloroflexota bacterium]|nr:hypothetical protein [Chloroflexota bacterium]
MSAASRRLAGILLVLYPTAVFGGVSLLNMLVNPGSGYAENAFRQDLWRAGHAHAAVLLLLSLVVLRYVDEANLSPGWQSLARHAVPLAAILLPMTFFLSVLPADATEPNGLIYLAYVGAVSLIAGLLTLGVGLLRGAPRAATSPRNSSPSLV